VIVPQTTVGVALMVAYQILTAQGELIVIRDVRHDWERSISRKYVDDENRLADTGSERSSSNQASNISMNSKVALGSPVSKESLNRETQRIIERTN
jgi:hypothetical protein